MSGIITYGSGDLQIKDSIYVPMLDISTSGASGVLFRSVENEHICANAYGMSSSGDIGFLIKDANNELVAIMGTTSETVDADFLLIQYYWISDGGVDLDTRTWVNEPPINYVVGWDRGFSDDYIHWGGDNVDPDGIEAVYVDLRALFNDYPSISEVSVRTGAFWYGPKNTGNITVILSFYKGGTMVNSGTNFYNDGGTLENEISYSKNVSLETMDGSSDGEFLGYAVYNDVDKTFSY